MSGAGDIGVAVGPPAVVGLVGYFVARLQFLSARRARADEHRRKRQDAYHRFLVSALSWERTLLGREPTTFDNLKRLNEEGQEALELLYLLAPDPIVELGQDWGDTEVAANARFDELSGPVEERFAQLHEEFWPTFSEIRIRLIQAMRDDVGPHAVD